MPTKREYIEMAILEYVHDVRWYWHGRGGNRAYSYPRLRKAVRTIRALRWGLEALPGTRGHDV
jgi:hypothetical protein